MEGRDEKGRFIKGRIETTEERLRRISSMRESWKNRDTYIGDLIKECPRIYNSWRAFMFTEKGKKIGHSEEWSNFRTFYEDVRSSYQPGLIFRRLDITKPFSKENFIWVTPEVAKDMGSGRIIQIEYNGETHTIADWADKIGTTVSAISIRYHRHKNDYSVEEILYGKKKLRNSKLPKDKTQTNIRSKASKMISSYKHTDMKNCVSICDVDIDWMIENILNKPCIYCGDTKRVGCDRIDNNLGHTKDNVVPCCIECNTARNNYFTYEEMRRLGKTIASIKEDRLKQKITIE